MLAYSVIKLNEHYGDDDEDGILWTGVQLIKTNSQQVGSLAICKQFHAAYFLQRIGKKLQHSNKSYCNVTKTTRNCAEVC